MRIPLDRESPVPLYTQIEQHLRDKILSGALPVGTKLPSSRQLATSLGVNRITVTNAYAEIEAEGLIYTRLGSGTFVAESTGMQRFQKQQIDLMQAPPPWQQAILRRFQVPSQERLERLAASASPPSDLINFAEGHGPEELFPAADIAKALFTVLRRDGNQIGGYGDYAGYRPLRATIVHILASQGIPADPDEILITSGAQQALALVASLLIRTGDAVLVENPTYSTAIDLFTTLGAHLVGVPVDEQGMQVEQVEELLRTVHPSLIYTIPTFQNPSGTCLSGTRRRLLVHLAARYNVPILEDEFVGDLRYEGHAQPALKALDPGGQIIYLGTFSKVLMPGLRLGYLVASGPIYDRLLQWKRINDLACSNLIQRALEAYITVGKYEAHLHRACRVYRPRRDAMLSALKRYLPAGTRWYTPQGGLFIWLHLPPGTTVEMLYPLAMRAGVEFMPGSLCYTNKNNDAHARLTFAMHPPDRIEEGIQRLGQAMTRCLTLQESIQPAVIPDESVDC